MAFGFPAYYESTLENKVNYSKSDLLELIKKTYLLIEFHTDNMIYVKSKVNMWSWGEKIEIKLHDNSITIKSKCFFPLQCVDWGKNKENVCELIIILGLN